ncbi:MAG TPA: Gfo/Idh/MocA family oxidoreductase [Verrucomicrobiota bacterium]|nr:Gfo/Idh/MocA family oxidoreductase [Verrucomicrobiota bacterium]HNU51638.1 Gfo/Idh/MocA family oxidoreductase [Verrucomicrobiota bacterium]
MQPIQTPAVSGGDTRRSFIKKAATATAAVATTSLFRTPVYGQTQAPSTGRVIGANDRIVVGFVGLGGQGMFHLRTVKANADKTNTAIGAVCDLWAKRREAAKAEAGSNPQTYTDYRKMIEQKDIDAVLCATVDHWHARIAIDAMRAGKHVYVEKPLSRYLTEAFEVWDAVKATRRVFQVGSQGCSDAKWHKCAELIKAGKIGPLVLGQGSYMRNNPKGEWNYTIDQDFKADGIQWDQWLGPDIKKRADFSPDHFFRWRKYYPYCAGLLGDLFPHRLHPLVLATGNPEFPVRVAAIGTRKIHTDKNTPGTPERDVPECLTLIAEFPSGYSLMVCSSSVNEVGLPDVIRGHMGTLMIGGNRVELKPERPFTEDMDPEDYPNLEPVEDVGVHEANWFSCIRSNKAPNADIELAIRVQAIVSLGELSDRLGITCHFDEKTRAITDGSGKKVTPLSYGVLEPS